MALPGVGQVKPPETIDVTGRRTDNVGKKEEDTGRDRMVETSA